MKRTLALVPLLLLAACGGGNGKATGAGPSAAAATGAPAADGVIAVRTTDDFRFVPSTISAKAGDIRIRLSNDGSYPHNFAVKDVGFTSKTVTGAPGSKTTDFVLRISKPGTYKFVCTFHSQAGMVGSLTVTP